MGSTGVRSNCKAGRAGRAAAGAGDMSGHRAQGSSAMLSRPASCRPKFTLQEPLQSVSPDAQEHLPLTHGCPDEQDLLHLPQLSSSFSRSCSQFTLSMH